ncbi:MAG: hypothetical protein ACJ75R_00305 [Solirubrobacterales bacterium]
MAGERNGSTASTPGPCPVCGEQLYGWLAPEARRVLDRCENCGVVVERGVAVDLVDEWRRLGDGPTLTLPNRGSLQATIGLQRWAALGLSPGELVLTRRSLALLAERNGAAVESASTPPARRGQAWMWQTLLNGLTFHDNFAREWRAGRLRPSSATSRPRFYVDLVVTVLAAPLVALVSAPLELGAALAGRGGELRAEVRRPRAGPSPSL